MRTVKSVDERLYNDALNHYILESERKQNRLCFSLYIMGLLLVTAIVLIIKISGHSV